MGKKKSISSAAEKYISDAEERFKKVSSIKEDISTYPLLPHLETGVETNKSKSKEFGEVFTPLWLVDEMTGQVKLSAETHTLDLCAGYGQFSIRLLRKLHQQHPTTFDPAHFLKHHHSFSELQLSSCYKLLRIFGMNINLFIGDSKELPKLPEVASGIWVYLESMKGWIPLTHTIRELMFIGDTKRLNTEAFFTKHLQRIIDKLNKRYTKMKEIVINIKFSSDVRLHALKLLDEDLYDLTDDKTVHTPTSVVKELLEDVADLDKKQILVLFNGEIVEALIHAKKVKRENIIFGVQQAKEARAKFIGKMYGVDSITFADDKPKSILQALSQKKWDVVLSNPPYNRGLDLKILQELLDANVAKEYVVVHPSTWLLDQKYKKPQYITFKDTLSKKLRSVKLFNGNAAFGIGLFVPCAITHIDMNYDSSMTDVDLFADHFVVDSIKDITKFGSHWKTIVEPFFTTIETYIQVHGQIWSHNENKIVPDRIYAQLACIRANVSKNPQVLINSDFYTMCVNDAITNKGIRESRLDKPGGKVPTFGFQTEIERDNFLSYLNTDFARFCLALYKIGQHLENGELEIIPWMDFTQPWDDEKLFAHFDIDQQTQDYIRSFLPDYYGIRSKVAVSVATKAVPAPISSAYIPLAPDSSPSL